MDGAEGVPAAELDDEALRRQLAHLHATRHDTLLGGSESAWNAHTERMLELEAEFIRRFPQAAAADPRRTRAGSRREAGQPTTSPRSPGSADHGTGDPDRQGRQPG